MSDINNHATSDTKNDDFKESIKNLRLRLEKVVEELKNLEKKGDEDSASCAIWSVYYIWNGKEYGDLEKMLKDKGYKSNICIQNEKKR